MLQVGGEALAGIIVLVMGRYFSAERQVEDNDVRVFRFVFYALILVSATRCRTLLWEILVNVKLLTMVDVLSQSSSSREYSENSSHRSASGWG